MSISFDWYIKIDAVNCLNLTSLKIKMYSANPLELIFRLYIYDDHEESDSFGKKINIKSAK